MLTSWRGRRRVRKSARIRCRVLVSGELKSRRHINLPGVKVNLPAFTEKDRGDATVAIVTSGPDTRNEAIHHVFFAAIAGAEREVLITTPYFVPTEALLVAMEVAAMRGVDLKILLPGRSNHMVTFHAGRSFYSELLESGVELREYVPGIVHAKTLVADGKVALVGSANMDVRSFRLNFEVHTLVHDTTTADAIRSAFRAEAVDSRQVELAAWGARPWTLRVKEGAARLVSPLL